MADGTGKPEAVGFGPLEDSLGFLLRLAQLQNFTAFYEKLGGLGLRPGAFTVLMLVGENPGIRQGVLASALMIKRAHMTKMVQAMEAEGVLNRTVPAEDRRAFELRLTEAGEKRLSEIRAEFDVFEASSAGLLSPSEARQLKDLLRKYLGHPPQGEKR